MEGERLTASARLPGYVPSIVKLDSASTDCTVSRETFGAIVLQVQNQLEQGVRPQLVPGVKCVWSLNHLGGAANILVPVKPVSVVIDEMQLPSSGGLMLTRNI